MFVLLCCHDNGSWFPLAQSKDRTVLDKLMEEIKGSQAKPCLVDLHVLEVSEGEDRHY